MTESERGEKVERAIVDAAEQINNTTNWCRMVAFGQTLSPSTRRVLVRAVANDPTLTAALFAKDLPDVH